MPAPAATRGRRAGPRTVSARLSAHASLETRPDGHLIAHFDGYALDLGAFGDTLREFRSSTRGIVEDDIPSPAAIDAKDELKKLL